MTVKELIERLQAEENHGVEVFRATDGDVAAKRVEEVSSVTVKVKDMEVNAVLLN